VGLERGAFERERSSSENRKRLVESKKEGLRNGVEATPTLFINGRRYHGDLDRESLLDVLEEEADRVEKGTHCVAGPRWGIQERARGFQGSAWALVRRPPVIGS